MQRTGSETEILSLELASVKGEKISAYEDDRVFLVEKIVEERLAPRSQPPARRASIDGFQRIRAMEAEHAIEPSDRGTTQGRKSAEEGNEGREGDEQNAHEDLLIRLHCQLRLMSPHSKRLFVKFETIVVVEVEEGLRGVISELPVLEKRRRLAAA